MKKILYLVMVLVLVVTFTIENSVVAISIPRLGIGSPSSGTVQVGGTITYPVNIYNDATSVTLKASDIRIAGVTADISVTGSGNSYRTIVLSNIQGSVGSVGYISYVAGGVATNERGGNREMNITSAQFTIVATPAPAPQPQPENNNTNVLPPQENNDGNNNTNTQEPTPEQVEDKEAPKMIIDGYTSESVGRGESISFKVKYTDNVEMGEITLNKTSFLLAFLIVNSLISPINYIR